MWQFQRWCGQPGKFESRNCDLWASVSGNVVITLPPLSLSLSLLWRAGESLRSVFGDLKWAQGTRLPLHRQVRGHCAAAARDAGPSLIEYQFQEMRVINLVTHYFACNPGLRLHDPSPTWTLRTPNETPISRFDIFRTCGFKRSIRFSFSQSPGNASRIGTSTHTDAIVSFVMLSDGSSPFWGFCILQLCQELEH